jgi:hypothetical protein
MLLHHRVKSYEKIITEAKKVQVINAYIKIKNQNLFMTTISVNP